MTPVTDQTILSRLNGPVPVTDPAILAKLDAPENTLDRDIKANVRDPISAFGHNFMNPIHGAAQLIEHGLGSIGVIPKETVASDDAWMAKREADYQANVPDSGITNTAAVAGAITPFATDVLSKGLSAAGEVAAKGVSGILPEATPGFIARLAPRVASGAMQGGTVGAINPVNKTDTPYGEQKSHQVGIGTLIGGAIPIATDTIKGAYNAAKGVWQPFTNRPEIVGNALSKWAGNDQATLEKLQNAKELVPGSVPTTAQVIANPDIVQAEKALMNNPAYKGKFMERELSNNDARLGIIRKIAGTPQAVKQAIADRADDPVISEWIGAGGRLETGNPVDAKPIVKALEKLQKSSLSVRPTINSAAKDILGTIESNSEDGMIPPGHLDALRQNVRDYMAKYSPNGVVSSQQEAASVPIKNAIIDTIEAANPGYSDYLAAYAKHSSGINTMQAAQSILANIDNRAANASGTPQLSLSSFNSQLAKALKSSPYGIDPSAKAALESVGGDLQRGTISNSVRAAGSDTAYNLQAPGWIGKQLYGENFGGPSNAVKAIGGGLGYLAASPAGPMGAIPAAAGGAYAASKLAGFAGNHMNSLLAEALLNPNKAAELIALAQKVPEGSLLAEELNKALPQLGGLIGTKR